MTNEFDAQRPEGIRKFSDLDPELDSIIIELIEAEAVAKVPAPEGYIIPSERQEIDRQRQSIRDAIAGDPVYAEELFEKYLKSHPQAKDIRVIGNKQDTADTISSGEEQHDNITGSDEFLRRQKAKKEQKKGNTDRER